MGRLRKGLGRDMSVAESAAKGKTAGWQDQVYDLLRRHNVTQFAYVPDAGHKILIDRSLADPGVQSVLATLDAWRADYEVWPIQSGGGPWTAVPNAFEDIEARAC